MIHARSLVDPRAPRRAGWPVRAAVATLVLLGTAAAVHGAVARGGSAAAGQGSAGVLQQPTVTASATYAPWSPSGTWSVLHGPNRDPLWRANAPVLRGLHLAPGADGVHRGWAVGEGGTLVRFDGAAWRVDESLEPRATAPKRYQFHDVFVKADDDVWLVGRVDGDRNCEGCGALLHYDGRRWRELDRYEFRVNGRMGALNAIDMMQDEGGDWYGWAVGDDADFDRFKAMILRHNPDGTWRVWIGHNIAKNLYDVRMVSATEAWAVGQDGVESRYNEDGGAGLWPPLGRSGADTLYAVDLADQLSGWDGGFRGRLNKYRGHCHDNDSSTQCWFQNEAMPIRTASGSQWAVTVYAIDLLDRDRGWLVGASSGRVSTVAHTSGPRNWTLAGVEGDPGKDLRGLQMLGPDVGYAVGQDGVILVYRADGVPTAVPTVAATTTATATATAEALPTATDEPTPGTVSPSPAATDPGATWTATPSAEPGAGTVSVPSATSEPTVDAATATPTPTESLPTEVPDPASATPVPPAPPVVYLPLAARRR